ncbi:FtsJ-like methyltransferase-domain-containing protein [Mrakia frigida]|uniref:FtsJ-like methyltransferase-domain-containing protein n=1 Tax=Mrakia frigida TaxID=29902 RepID=UPI003FCC0DBE
MTSSLLPQPLLSLCLRSSSSLRPPLLLLHHRRTIKTKSSAAWLVRQQTDHLVASRGAFRARSAFKLLELSKHYKILKPSCKLIIDLGAAPGSWSQVALQGKGGGKVVVAVDLLPMAPIPGVHIIQGDFLDQITQAKIKQKLLLAGDGLRLKADLVMSDMGSNMSGLASMDQEASWKLTKMVFEFCKVGLRVGHFHGQDGIWRSGGTMIMKHFACPEIAEFRRTHLQRCFEEVYYDKPEACRKESAEGYFVCKGYKGDILQKAIEPPAPKEKWAEEEGDL